MCVSIVCLCGGCNEATTYLTSLLSKSPSPSSLMVMPPLTFEYLPHTPPQKRTALSDPCRLPTLPHILSVLRLLSLYLPVAGYRNVVLGCDGVELRLCVDGVGEPVGGEVLPVERHLHAHVARTPEARGLDAIQAEQGK